MPIGARSSPPAMLAAGALLDRRDCHDQPSNVGWFGICALAAWAGSSCRSRLAAAGHQRSALLGFVGQWLAMTDEPGWGAWIAGTVFSGGRLPSWPGGSGSCSSSSARPRPGSPQRAAAEERNRIAHELHDVIGHALTVSLLHITSARLALAEDPAEAGDALAEAERLSQQSLADVRAVVGLMKDPSAPAPLPGRRRRSTTWSSRSAGPARRRLRGRSVTCPG